MTIDKHTLRKTMKVIINDLNWPILSQQIQHHLKEFLCGFNDQDIAAFYPIKNEEPDILPLFSQCLLPRIAQKCHLLEFHLWHQNDPLEGEWFSMPLFDSPLVHPKVILVPLLAFTKQGIRLGRGKGFYDATLKYYKTYDRLIPTIGIAAKAQELAFIPNEDHDIAIDHVITEKGLQTFPLYTTNIFE